MSEIDVPDNKKILAMVVAVIVSLVVVVIGVEQYYDSSVRAEIDRKSNRVEDPRKIRTNQAAADCLKNYQYVDATQAQVRIPVSKAEELVLADWDKRPTAPVSTTDPRLPDAVAPPAGPAGPASAPTTQPTPAASQPATAPVAPAAPPASQPATSH